MTVYRLASSRAEGRGFVKQCAALFALALAAMAERGLAQEQETIETTAIRLLDEAVEVEPLPAAVVRPPEDALVPASIDGGTMLPTGPFLMPGVNLGLAFDRSKDVEFTFGGEISFAMLQQDLFWAGSYVDALYSTQSDETRLSMGPELGIGFIGVDAGYLLKLGGAHGTQHGVSVRPMLTTGVVTAYFRSSWLLGSKSDWSGEVGVLLKLPIELS